MEFSDVYDPFEEIVYWLLSLITKRPTISVLNFDCERYNQQIICDYLGGWDCRDDYKYVALFTFACDWDDNESPTFLIIPIEEFVYTFYYRLLDYYIENKPTFMIEWGNECDWDNDPFILDKVLHNTEIKKRLPRKGVEPKPFTPSAEVPITENDAFAIIDGMLSEEQKKELFTIPRSEDSGRKYREFAVWLRNNWLYSPDHELKELKDRRFKWYRMMSKDKIENSSSWVFSDTDCVPYDFLDRYEEHLKSIMDRTL